MRVQQTTTAAIIVGLGIAIGGLMIGRGFELGRSADRDSKSSIGGIMTASQGVFEILPRDQAQGITQESQVDKTVRVVSTVNYYVKD